MHRKWAITLAVYVLAAIGIGAGRGWLMAAALGGRYPFSYMAHDVAAFGLILLILALFNAGLRAALRKAFGTTGAARQFARYGVYGAIMLTVVFPFLLATLQFHPQRIAPAGTPRDWGLDFSSAAFESEGLRLSGWFIPVRNPLPAVVLVLHGLNANKENFLLPAQLAHQLGYDVLTFDFRSHGDSEGHTSTFGFKESADIKAAYDWIARTHPGRPVYALAYSMGGAAAIHAAAEYGIFDRLVLDSTFADVEHVAQARLFRPFGPLAPVLWHGGRFWSWVWTGIDVARNRPVEWIAKIDSRPILLIHGTGDPIIPYTESVLLQRAAGPNAQLWLVDNAAHVQSIDHPDYQKRLGAFFAAGR